MEQAQSALDKAIALNAKAEAERLNLIAALNKAIVVIGTLALFGVAFVWSMNEADRQFSIQDKINQEASVNVYRR
ncbi:MAG: hypothetical protein AAAB20_07885 [Rhizobium sp.]|uniref:hypothetical protein n=1 Tax=Rhizobium sp. TaxID=391 RepID=UPI0030F1B88C